LKSLGFIKVDNSNLHLMGGLNIRLVDIFIDINVTDLINQVSQLLRAELKELVDVAQATIEPIKLCDEK